MKALIIGNKGAYGSWLTRRLENNFGENCVFGTEKDSVDPIEILVPEFQVIINCASMSASRKVIEEVVAVISSDSLIIDLTTSKKEVGPILNSAVCDVVMIHPMSAPPENNSPLTDDVKVSVICEKINNPENYRWYTDFCLLFGGVREEISFERHNQREDIVQSVPHLLLVTFGEAVANSGFTLDEVEQMATPVSKPLCQALRRHFSKGNADTFAELQRLADRSIEKPMGTVTDRIRLFDWLAKSDHSDFLSFDWKKIKGKLGL